MTIITFNGPIGSGGPEIGLEVSEKLNIDYVDRLILAEAAKRIGATVQAVSGKEHKLPRTRDRIGRFAQNLLERSAMSGAGGEPYFGPGIEVLLSRDYYSSDQKDTITSTTNVTDTEFITATTSVITDLADAGDVIIVGRASNLILATKPNALHVRVRAPLEQRIETIMNREHLTHENATTFVNEHENARIAYFKRFFKVDPNDPDNYHITLNMGNLKTSTATAIVIHAAQDVSSDSHE